MVSFNTSLGKSLDIQTDVLIDILSWELVIANRMIDIEAKEKGLDPEGIHHAWQEKKLNFREKIIEQLFGKYGPDPSKDLGL